MPDGNLEIAANTPFPELNAVLRDLASSVKQILSDNFVGAFLQGSFAIGDFDRYSDCDFVIVVAAELSDIQHKMLQANHKRIYKLDSEWARHLEGSYFPKAVLHDISQYGSELWYLDNGSDCLVKSNHCNSIVVRWILREKGVVLSGPKPLTLIEPIPISVLRKAILVSINSSGNRILKNPEQYNNRFYQSFITLHFCRKLHDLHTGTIGSKRSGAEWVIGNLGLSWSGLIDRAWLGRPNPEISINQSANEADFRRTLQFVEAVISEANKFAADMGI